MGIELMMLTGETTRAAPQSPVEGDQLKMSPGTMFEIDFSTVVAVDEVIIKFTGFVHHTNPIQLEIWQISGEYREVTDECS
jgi:hypothetical protein